MSNALKPWDDPRYLASRLRHRITLQEPSETNDGLGGTTRSWSDVATVWAEIIPLRQGSERMFAIQQQMQVTHRVIMRYREGITADMRISYAGRAFNIRSVSDVQERKTILEIYAEEGVAT